MVTVRSKSMWCARCHRVPLSTLAVPADAQAAGGAPGTVQRAFVLWSSEPSPGITRIGAWDASQVKTQAASPDADIILEGVQRHTEEGSCRPGC